MSEYTKMATNTYKTTIMEPQSAPKTKHLYMRSAIIYSIEEKSNQINKWSVNENDKN